MSDQEREDRKYALCEACRTRLPEDGAEQVVSNANKYLAFLQGKEAERPS